MKQYEINTNIKKITTDSRKVDEGSLFLAYLGENKDGRQYIPNAIEHGAIAIWWEPKAFEWNPAWQVENLAITGLRQQVGRIADQFYGSPSNQLWMIGVTGTNGKTSITHWLSQCFNQLNQKTAVVGTLGNGLPNDLSNTNNTTPDALILQEILSDFVKQKVINVAMEVSSHGLDQGRVNGVKFDVAVLTNLTRDHLDYHGTMENYANAKRRLFVSAQLKVAVLNIDDEFGKDVAKNLIGSGVHVMTYGIGHGDVSASKINFNQIGFSFLVATPFGQAEVKANLLGRFNVSNILAVLATLLVSKVNLKDAVEAISSIQSVAGRMQQFGGGDLPLVVVDYAHTPDALENVLTTLRSQAARLVCVFGCGGNRDAGKRAVMGKIASDIADAVVLTSDNPRKENPMQIIDDVLEGMHGKYAVEPDRAKAIEIAISTASPGDVIIIAGKGHENYQDVDGEKNYFSDAEHAQKALKRLVGVLA